MTDEKGTDRSSTAIVSGGRGTDGDAVEGPITQELRAILVAGAAELRMVGNGPADVRHRAGRHRRRRRIAAVAASALIAGGAIVAGSSLVGDESADESSTTLAASGTDAPSLTESSTSLDGASLTWTGHDGTIAWPERTVVDGDLYYALSTAPGPNGSYPADTIYRSEDGVNWTSAPVDTAAWETRIGAAGGLLYTIATAPASGSGVGAEVSMSPDGGDTWDVVSLPEVALEPLESGSLVLDEYDSVDIAAGPQGVVASVGRMASFDVSWMTSGYQGAVWLEWTSSGVDVVVATSPDCGVGFPVVAPADQATRDACGIQVVDSYGWDDLGIGGPTDLVARTLFVSSDGSDWEPVGDPFPGQVIASMSTVGDEFVVTTYSVLGGTPGGTYRSQDGRTWTVMELPTPTARVVGAAGVRLVAVDQREDAQHVLVSADGGTRWTVVDARALVDGGPSTWIGNIAVGPLGIAISTYDDVGGPAFAFSPDGSSWTVESTDALATAVDRPVRTLDWLMVGANEVIVGASGAANPDGTFETVALVGVPG